jgi:hypothetical protein
MVWVLEANRGDLGLTVMSGLRSGVVVGRDEAPRVIQMVVRTFESRPGQASIVIYGPAAKVSET